jgi:23S rRNA (guanine2445-N2)-methyltransferase / 23S rRNA (guanine2069-N7)-methyltransferase
MEQLLSDELLALGATEVKQTVAAVHFQGELKIAYKACLWSRIANRVLMPLASFRLDTVEDLYENAVEISWEDHLLAQNSIAIDFIGTSKLIDNSMYGAQLLKDAIVDRIRRIEGGRPSVDAKSPDIRIQARLHKGQVAVSLDISGESLHRRGYRTGQGSAPLKENLACAILLRSGWPAIAKQGGALIDPMCGSGTILIEAALMAADIAPALNRETFGFTHWLKHDEPLWESVLADAEERKTQGLENFDLDIRGYDGNSRVLDVTVANIENAGLDEHIRIAHKPLDQFGKATAETGLLVTNPPYGARMGEVEQLIPLYEKLGVVLQKNFTEWRAAIYTGNLDLARELDLSPSKQYSLFNGSIACKVLVFDNMQSKSEQIAERLSKPAPVQPLSEEAKMLFNRLQKNQRRLKGWLKKSSISCYRLYDADIPEYSAAIDIYEKFIYVQEYAAPSTIEERVAKQRFETIKRAVKEFSGNEYKKVYYKERRRQKGDSQYQRLNEETSESIVVNEGRARFEVNLSDYLDTGLFLDHRPVRALLAEMTAGKTLLNLFCYTASADGSGGT